MADSLRRGSVVWADLGLTRGTEQSGIRPALVISADDFLARAPGLAMIVPVTSKDRGWPQHVPLQGSTGLPLASFVMTEQARTISRERISRVIGSADELTLATVSVWLRDFLDL